MNATFQPNLDKSLYTKTKLNRLTDGAMVSVSGSVSVCRKPCASGSMFLLTLCSAEGKATATVFHDNPMYAFVETMPTVCNVMLYGKVALNGKYTNLLLDNIEFHIRESVNPDDLDPGTSTVYCRLINYVAKIEDDFLRNVVNNVYSSGKIMKRFLAAPASEFSAGAFIGGLAQRTLATCELIDNAFAHGKPVGPAADTDMLFASALLHDVGRAFIYDIAGDGQFFKNEYSILDTDTSLTRDFVRAAIKDVLNIKDEDGNKLYAPKNGDVVKELIHIIDSCKYFFAGGEALSPRTKTAMVFAHLISIADAVSMFDALKASNIGEEKLLRAFDGGKTYFFPAD